MQSKKSSHFLDNRNEKLCPAPSAIIDIGTNTVRLLIGCIADGKVIRFVTGRAVTRLGKDILKTGELSISNTIKSIKYIGKFKEICKKYGVKKIHALGTSALRESTNSDDFLVQTKKSTGIDIDIISGAKEAELTLKGVLGAGIKTRMSEENKCKAFVIVDIGGGSTEWIFNEGSKTIMNSIPVGAVKLSDTFIENDPPTPEELKNMRNHILHSFDSSLITPRPSLFLIATGGTAATLASIDIGIDKYDGDKIHMHKITLAALKSIYKKLIMLSTHERLKINGLEVDRADIIIPGTLILLTFMEKLRAKNLIVSDYGLLEGALISYHML